MASLAESAATMGYVLENARDTCADLFEAIAEFRLREVRVPKAYEFPLQSVPPRSINDGDRGQVLTAVQKLERQLGTLGVSSLAEEDSKEIVGEATTALQKQVDALIGRLVDESRSDSDRDRL